MDAASVVSRNPTGSTIIRERPRFSVIVVGMADNNCVAVTEIRSVSVGGPGCRGFDATGGSIAAGTTMFERHDSRDLIRLVQIS